MVVRLWDVRHLAKATQAHAQPPQKQQASTIEKHSYRLNQAKRWSSSVNRFFVHTRVPHDGHRERTKYPTRDQIKIKTLWDLRQPSSLSDHLTRPFLAPPLSIPLDLLSPFVVRRMRLTIGLTATANFNRFSVSWGVYEQMCPFDRVLHANAVIGVFGQRVVLAYQRLQGVVDPWSAQTCFFVTPLTKLKVVCYQGFVAGICIGCLITRGQRRKSIRGVYSQQPAAIVLPAQPATPHTA